MESKLDNIHSILVDSGRLFELFEIADVEVEEEAFSLARLQWAACIVWSRAQYFDRGNEMALALVPVVAQLNHQGDASGSLDVLLDDHMMLSSFQVQALKSVNASEELSISYGAKTSSDFVLYYGFVPQPPSEIDIVPVQLQLSHQDPDRDFKLEIVDELELPKDLQFELRPGVMPQQLLRAMRVLTLDRVELIRFREEIDSNKKLPMELEDIVAQTGSAVLSDIYSRYATTWEQDRDLLLAYPANGLSLPKRVAIQLRMVEKRILKFGIRTFNRMRPAYQRKYATELRLPEENSKAEL